MRKITKQKTADNTIWAGLLLGLLLIISPCSVRNILQNDFGLKTTKTPNQSKTAFHKTSNCCVYYDLSKIIKDEQVKKNYKFTSSTLLGSQILNFSIPHSCELTLLTWGKSTENDIPLYILYKKLKVFDSLLRYV